MHAHTHTHIPQTHTKNEQFLIGILTQDHLLQFLSDKWQSQDSQLLLTHETHTKSQVLGTQTQSPSQQDAQLLEETNDNHSYVFPELKLLSMKNSLFCQLNKVSSDLKPICGLSHFQAFENIVQ